MHQERFGFLLFDGFSNLVLANAIEPLRAANQLSDTELFQRRLLTVTGEAAISSSGIAIRPDANLAEAGPLDILFVVAGYDFRERSIPENLVALRLAAHRAGRLGGLDTGSWLLAAAGLIDGHAATIHWQELDTFAEAFPTVGVSADRYVVDGRVISAGGATTVLDLMLRHIRDRHGHALTFDVMNLFIYDVERAIERPFRGARSQRIMALAPHLVKAISVMRKNVETPIPISIVAEEAACSPSSLARLFHRELGMPPGKYYQLIRLKSARRLVEETDLSVTEIAVRTGFASSATLSRAFTQHFRSSIRSVRQRRAV